MLASYFSFGKYLHLIALTLRGAYAYTWSLKNAPSQCGQLNIAIAGDNGAPPFHILIAPFGPSPLPNSIDARAILDIPLPDSKREIEFILTYPANSQFVAVVRISPDNKLFSDIFLLRSPFERSV